MYFDPGLVVKNLSVKPAYALAHIPCGFTKSNRVSGNHQIVQKVMETGISWPPRNQTYQENWTSHRRASSRINTQIETASGFSRQRRRNICKFLCEHIELEYVSVRLHRLERNAISAGHVTNDTKQPPNTILPPSLNDTSYPKRDM